LVIWLRVEFWEATVVAGDSCGTSDLSSISEICFSLKNKDAISVRELREAFVSFDRFNTLRGTK